MKALWSLIESELGENFAESSALTTQVQTLSESFTEGRKKLAPNYLSKRPNMNAYLAYFLPLNFMKVKMLLDEHKKAWPATLPRTLRWIDLGCGPGTATLAAMASLKDRFPNDGLVNLHIDLVDNQPEALEVAESLIMRFAEELGLFVEVARHHSVDMKILENDGFDLVLAANVLNELPPADDGTKDKEVLLKLWELTKGVMLVLEPGHRVASQRLIRFRDRLLKDAGKTVTIIGPCPHHERCPVYRSKHWCHFSEPHAEGRLIDLNLRIFKNPRRWLKFSYLLTKREAQPAYDRTFFRAIGDLHLSQGKHAIDLCKPDEKFVLYVPKNLPPDLRSRIVRGATISLADDRELSAQSLSPRTEATSHPRAGSPQSRRPRTERERGGGVKPKVQTKIVLKPRSTRSTKRRDD